MSAVPQKIEPRNLSSSKPLSESSLYRDQTVEQAMKGSADAFEQLIRQHQAVVRLFLVRFADCSETADDLAQEVFVVAYQRLSEFRQTSKFSTWLLGIARNKALSYLRSQIRQRKHEQEFFEFEISRRQYLKLDGNDGEQFDEHLVDLKSCLDALPEQSNKLVDDFYFKKQSANAIASERQQTSGAIRMKLLRIRAVLQKCIAEKNEKRSGKLDS